MSNCQTTLNQIFEETGVHTTVFSDSGIMLAHVGEIADYPLVKVEQELAQNGWYYYPFTCEAKRYCLAVKDGEGAKTVAKLLSRAIAGSLVVKKDWNRLELMQYVLSGQAESEDILRLKNEYKYPDGKYYIMALSSYKNQESVLNMLSVLSDSPYDYFAVTESGVIVFIKYVGNTEGEVREFAESLVKNALNETGSAITVCTGETVKSVENLPESYFSALLGIKTATRLNYGSKVYSYKEFLAVNLIASLPKSEFDTYRKNLLKSDFITVLEDKELMDTVETFFANSLNVSETARAMYVHRNTLNYRLNKIERLTGLNVRGFSDAMAFRILEFLYRTEK